MCKPYINSCNCYLFYSSQIVSLMKKSLGSLWVNDINVTLPLVTVAKFVTLINEHLGKCAQGVHTGSHKHRLLYNAQQNYNAVSILV